MRGYNYWSYAPYKPLLWETGDIYICRIAPGANTIHLEWLEKFEHYEIYYRKRGEGEFLLAGDTEQNEYDIKNLENDTDYEFFVQSGDKKSRVRLARTGETIGTVVNYLHPEDQVYSFSGRALCSPSLLKHPDGYLLASMDVYQGKHPQNLTLIFRSDDNGESWHYVSELMPCFWGKMFIHKGDLYMLACSTEYGDLLIGKSTDGGKTFSAPVCLLRGSNGKSGYDGVHKNPQNIFIHKGRIYESLEWGNWSTLNDYCHAAMVMSCDVNDDLLVPENWSFTEPRKFDHFAPEVEDIPKRIGTIEGTLTLSPEGKLLNIMRFAKRNYVLAYEVNTSDPEAPLSYHGIIKMDTARSKMMIKYDEQSGKYYAIVSKLYEGEDSPRNLLALLASEDLEHWYTVCHLYDFRYCNVHEVGLQYVDFEFDGEDIIYLCRTAINHAANFHDANYQTFHRICNFRKL